MMGETINASSGFTANGGDIAGTGTLNGNVTANDGGDAVSGSKFAGAPNDGDVVNIGGQDYAISYTGDTGNDVVLGSPNAAPVINDQSFTVDENSANTTVVGTAAASAVSFTLGADDVSSADQNAGFTYNIDWDGDGNVDETVSGPDGTTVDHAFTAGGTTTVIVTATDKDGGVSDAFPFEINVILPVNVDVKPDNSQNKVNVKSKGVIPVAIYTTADFDATDVDGNSVELAGVSANHYALEDVNGDGDLDMILHFAVQDLVDSLGLDLDSGESESVDIVLAGLTTDGTDIFGGDTINFFLPGKRK